MRCNKMAVLMIAAAAGISGQAMSAAVTLGTAGDFAVLAGTTVTNTGATIVDGGDVGVSPGSAITGFFAVDGGPGLITPPYTTHSADAVALQAQTDLTTAYDVAAGLAPTQSFSPIAEIGGLTLDPGVYFFPTSVQLTGTLTLDAQGDANAQFVFQIGSTLITAPNASVVMINDGDLMTACNVFWQVGSSATLDVGTEFRGHILALQSITMNTGANILGGSALARNGAVTLDGNNITNCQGTGVAVPLPAAAYGGLSLIGAILAVHVGRRIRRTTK
jgi:Ice-binding-like